MGNDQLTGEQLKDIRNWLGENQEIFAGKFGVDQSTVHRWETSGIPDRGTTALAVDRVLHVLIHEQLDRDEVAA